MLRAIGRMGRRGVLGYMSNTNDATHPEWRQLCQAALFETNPVKLLKRIAHARNAVLDRIEDGHTKPLNGEQAECGMLWLRLTLCAELRSVRMATSQRLVDPYREYQSADEAIAGKSHIKRPCSKPIGRRCRSAFRQPSLKYTRGGWCFLKTTVEPMRKGQLSSMP